MLDASKPFYRVKHSVLFNKLTRRGVPGYIGKLLSYWYMPSKLCESDGEIAFLVRFVFLMGCAKEVYYHPTPSMCIWMTSAVFLIVVILDVSRGILLLTT